MNVPPEKGYSRKIISEISSSPKNNIPILGKIPKMTNKPHYSGSEATETNNYHC